jgi:hypothetical protein
MRSSAGRTMADPSGPVPGPRALHQFGEIPRQLDRSRARNPGPVEGAGAAGRLGRTRCRDRDHNSHASLGPTP